ncbi:MAG: [FeFe] hydrogenase H-cluster radical SAM maturase HydE [Bacteroidales bacterium]|nr:[FeFe] hydrogenase H-cluster radical SAM maturase HydE [Bacteroidales bacterium]
MNDTISQIRQARDITLPQLKEILESKDEEGIKSLFEQAREVADSVYGKKVFIRGLIEISSHCRNDCLYCGLRRSQTSAVRYRLTDEQIIDCCDKGYRLGFRTFVLQGGEDAWFDDTRMVRIVSEIRRRYQDCAITLSLGERSDESYQRLFDAGANRYLLRHETADADHYGKLHPADMSFENRMRCLETLKGIGYQVGCGFMVGSPFQTAETIYKDLQFIRSFQPHMVGIGPFIPAHETPFADRPQGSVETTLRLLSIIRLLNPHVLLPATTALGTLHSLGRERGILAGANVVMPNLSPTEHRKDYAIYDNKICTGDEAAECRNCTEYRMRAIGYETVIDRGDYKS